MSALLDLCNSVKNPVDRAAEFTDEKKMSKAEFSAKQSANAFRKVHSHEPPYCPIWTERKSGSGRVVRTIKFENGVRLKRCSIGKEWHPADTEHFNINTHALTGMTSECRKCRKKNKE